MRGLFKTPETNCPNYDGLRLSWGNSCLNPMRLGLTRSISSFYRRALFLRLRCEACLTRFNHLHSLPRTVVGFHGCRRDFAEALVRGKISISEWKRSQNKYDWLGEGVYFWEYSRARAWEWATEHYPGQAAVVASEIQLGRCLDLADTAFTQLLKQSFDGIKEMYERNGWSLPKNEGRDFKLRKLDRLVIDDVTTTADKAQLGVHYQTVRCPFEEGEPVYDGGMIKSQSHIQIAVRDRSCLGEPVRIVGPEGG